MSNSTPTRRSFLRDAIRRFSQNRLALLGLFLVGFILFLALFADLLSPFAYDRVYFDRVLLMPFDHPEHPL
ncbi:MAG: peptide ABC transporter permease, partial [SAR324 cluster bacterium]|nr:peptide ABC transporter permease [SAR324 cluster bacterium]